MLNSVFRQLRAFEMSFEDNIFLKAAFGGGISLPPSSHSLQTTDAQTSSTQDTSSQLTRTVSTKTPVHRYTKIEDLLILQAVEQKGRNWRSILKFLCENADALGKSGEFYKKVNVNDKLIQERIRKRAAKLMDGEEKGYEIVFVHYIIITF